MTAEPKAKKPRAKKSPALIRQPPAPHPDEESIWRHRADLYNSQYAGPVHWQRAINVLAATGSLPLALREANIARSSFNDRRERFPEFAEAILEAQAFYREGVIEQTAHTRAVDGYLEPVFHKGAIVGYIRKFSDTLLVKLMEGNLEKYARKTDVNFNGKLVVEGGLPQRPMTAADVPAEVKQYLTLENPPQPPAKE